MYSGLQKLALLFFSIAMTKNASAQDLAQSNQGRIIFIDQAVVVVAITPGKSINGKTQRMCR